MRDEPNANAKGPKDLLFLGTIGKVLLAEDSWTVIMEVVTRPKKCVMTYPAEASDPENGWPYSSLPMHGCQRQ